MAKGQTGTDGAEKPKVQKGKYTVLEAQDVTLPLADDAPEGTEPQTVQAFVSKGEVEARSKNDAIRTAFNENVISGAGTYAAVVSRSFAPVKVEPKQRTALTWS